MYSFRGRYSPCVLRTVTVFSLIPLSLLNVFADVSPCSRFALSPSLFWKFDSYAGFLRLRCYSLALISMPLVAALPS